MAGHGLNLQWLADEILKRRNPDLKYVIYNRRIASANTGWKWAPYYGSNPHTDHIHASVGVGPDGYSKQPYDDTDKWLEEEMTPAEFLKLLQDPKVKAYFQAVAWQYMGGGIPVGMSTLGVLNDTYEEVNKAPLPSPVVLTDADKEEIAKMVAEELRGWSFLPAPKE
jgi:hypothetical protein